MLLSDFTILGVFGLAAVAAAQEMPECAGNCLVTHLEDSSCGPTDFECICADSELMANVEVCSMGTCTVLEGLGKSFPLAFPDRGIGILTIISGTKCNCNAVQSTGTRQTMGCTYCHACFWWVCVGGHPDPSMGVYLAEAMDSCGRCCLHSLGKNFSFIQPV